MRRHTDITFVLDWSGSMESIKDATEEGLAAFLSEQKKLPDSCSISVYPFSHALIENQFIENKDIHSVDKISIIPITYTALYSSLAKIIDKKGEQYSLMNEEDRPDKVILVVVTDGLDNCSSLSDIKRLPKMIEEQTNTYNWTFVYMGANQDAIETGMSLGLNQDSSLTYGTSSHAVKGAYGSLSSQLSIIRTSANLGDVAKSVNFTSEERSNSV